MPRTPENAAAAGAAAGDGQPGAGSALAVNGVSLTQLETKFMINMVASLKSKPDVDWEALATIMGVNKKSKSSSLWVCLLRVCCGCCFECLLGFWLVGPDTLLLLLTIYI